MSSSQLLSEAVAAYQLGDFARAHQLCSKVVAGDRGNLVALHLLGVLEAQQNNPVEALRHFDRALKAEPRHANILTDRGRVLSGLGRHDEALQSYEKAIAVNPRHNLALLNQACTLLLLERSSEALRLFDRLLELAPDYPLALHNRAIALTDLRRYQEAIVSADRALQLAPDYAEALQSRGIAYEYLRRHDLATADLKAALKLNPELDYLRGNVYWSQLNCCDWEGLAEAKAKIETDLRAGKRVITPFAFMAVSDAPRDQQTCASLYVAHKYPPVKPLAPARPKQTTKPHDRIRIGYLSADFRDHPVSQLLAGVIENHDRTKFEVSAISYGPDDGSALRGRLKSAFEHFIDVEPQSAEQIAHLIKDRGIDILVDLTGFTAHSRPAILALKPAPIQVSYLGYSGTMGARYMDYVIADRTIVEESDRALFTEKVVYLPDSFMAADAKRKISERVPSRAEYQLPDGAFVFCAFNNSYKISLSVFDAWMRLLSRVEGSVLWLSDMNETAKANLRREAQGRGVDPARLIFAPRAPLNEDHLARHRLADLFLDTTPYNAHATTNDALWAGLPVLTCTGASFAGRVASSLLKAVGLPELVTKITADYERTAFELAANSEKLAALRQKLAANRLTAPLFDTVRFTRHIEAAYTVMAERLRAGLAPDHIAVDSFTEGSER
jgi:predicted O-linked N-acetylglucosamine transferase (SPINDLY family)